MQSNPNGHEPQRYPSPAGRTGDDAALEGTPDARRAGRRDASHPVAEPGQEPVGHGTPTNRRGAARRPISLRVDVVPLLDQADLPSTAPLRRGVTVDLSASGLHCLQVGYLPVGSLVRLFIGVPDESGRLSCYARVVRCDTAGRAGYGLRFIGLGPLESDRLRRLVN